MDNKEQSISALKASFKNAKAVFAPNFSDKYQRNNKRTGRKNLRCFPCCSKGGHFPRRFCGAPVEVTLKNFDVHGSEFFAWAGFTTTDLSMFTPGQIVLETRLESLRRDRAHPTAPLMQSTVPEKKGKSTHAFSINKNNMGWHYEWKSNKHVRYDKHCLKVYIFVRAPTEGQLMCLGSFNSPEFTIYCRRRISKSSRSVKKKKASLAPTSESKKRKKIEVMSDSSISSASSVSSSSSSCCDSEDCACNEKIGNSKVDFDFNAKLIPGFPVARDPCYVLEQNLKRKKQIKTEVNKKRTIMRPAASDVQLFLSSLAHLRAIHA